MANFDSATLSTHTSGAKLNRPPPHANGVVRFMTDVASGDADIADVFRLVRIPAESTILDVYLSISAAAGASVTGDLGYLHVNGASGDDAAAFINDANLNAGLFYRAGIPGLVTLSHDAYITCTIAGANFGTAKTLRAMVFYTQRDEK